MHSDGEPYTYVPDLQIDAYIHVHDQTACTMYSVCVCVCVYGFTFVGLSKAGLVNHKKQDTWWELKVFINVRIVGNSWRVKCKVL